MRMRDCDCCGAPAGYFTEVYDPLTTELRTYHFCADCQFTVALFVERMTKAVTS